MFNDHSSQASSVRGSQRQNRNASSFNILSHEPVSANQADIDKQLKKERQNMYRDQLDQMVTTKADKKAHERQASEPYKSSPLDPQRQWGGDSGLSQNPYGQGSYNDYGMPQHASDIERNYNLGSRPADNYNNYSQKESRPPTDPKANTFDQQDQLRGQLLDKIRSGYTNQNYQVYNAYQRAHEEKEQSRQNFERNVIDKAAQEKIARENEAAINDWDKKKRLQMETLAANRQAVEAKSSQKQREKEFEKIRDQQRNQDSIQQQKANEMAAQEKQRRVKEDTYSTLKQQMQDSASRKQQYGKDISPNKFKIGYDSIDNLANSRARQDQPLKNSSQLLNQDPYAQEPYAQNPYAQDPYGSKDLDQRQYEDLAQGMGNMDIGGYGKGAQDYPSSQAYGDQPYGGAGYEQAPPKRAQQQQQQPYNNEYLKIKDKFRHGGGFNIITNEYI